MGKWIRAKTRRWLDRWWHVEARDSGDTTGASFYTHVPWPRRLAEFCRSEWRYLLPLFISALSLLISFVALLK